MDASQHFAIPLIYDILREINFSGKCHRTQNRSAKEMAYREIRLNRTCKLTY